MGKNKKNLTKIYCIQVVSQNINNGIDVNFLSNNKISLPKHLGFYNNYTSRQTSVFFNDLTEEAIVSSNDIKEFAGFEINNAVLTGAANSTGE